MNKEKSSADPDVHISRAGKPRDRIFDCAQDLFHRRGIRGVGVEAIAEAAGTSKMALYRHFDSKDELILEYLNYKGRKSDEIWAEIEAQNPGTRVVSFTVSWTRPQDLSLRTSAGAISPTPPSN